MKHFKLFTKEKFKLLFLIFCLAASVPQLMAQTYTVAGNDTQALGSSWAPDNANNDMSRYSGNRYYLVKSVTYGSATSYQYKITVNHSWNTSYGDNGGSGNASYSVKAGSGRVCYVFDSGTHVPYVISSFQTIVVAGSDTQALGSQTWSTGNTANSMTTTDGITYTLTKQVDYAASVNNLQCKAVVDGSSWYGTSSGGNVYYNIPAAGSYTITYSFNVVTGIVTVDVQANAPITPDYYITGDNGLGLDGFKFNPTTTMTYDQVNDVYTYNYNVTTAGTYYFAFADGGGSDWTDFNANHRFGPTNGNETVTLGSWATTQKGSGSYAVTVDAGQVTITLDVTNMRYKVDGNELIIPVNYYVKGDDTTIFPNGWNDGASTAMTDNGDGTYTWTSGQFHLDSGTSYAYKVWGDDNSWHPNGDNATFSSNVPGTYTVTITYNNNNETVNATLNLIQADPTYDYDIHVRYTGEEPIENVFIYAWDAAGNLSDAWNGSTGGTALSSLTTQQINGYTYYKVRYTSYSSSINLIFNENGSSSTQTANLTANPGNNYFTYAGGSDVVGPSSQADVPDYFVVGEDANLFPNGWNTGSETLMTDVNGTYTLTLTNVHLNASQNYVYKVRGTDGSWYPDGDNASFSVDTRGTYNVVFTFDGTNVNAVATLVQADQLYTYDIYVRYRGNENVSNVFVYAWDNESALSDAWDGSTGGTALSSLTSQEINGHTYYKVTYTSYDSSIGVLFNENGSGDTKTADLTAEPGDNYFTYGGGSTVDGPNAQADDPVAYYVVGGDTDIFPNEWSTGSETLMTDNADGTYSWTSSNVHLTEEVEYEYKVRDNQGDWYPDGGNQTFEVNVPGTYTVTVTYDSNSGTVTATTTLIEADQVDAMYVIGNAGSQQWAANAGIAMELDGETGYYVLHNIVLTANSYFALAFQLGSDSQDWTTLNANRLNSTGDWNWAINNSNLGQWFDTRNYQDDDHNWFVEKSGAYDIFFNPNTRQVMVQKSHEHLYMSYGVDWSFANNSVEMTSVDGNIYQTTVTLNSGDYFLFSTAMTPETAIGAVDPNYEITDLMIGFGQRLDAGLNNFHFTGTTGKYIVVVNLEKNTATLRKTADATVTKIYLQKASNVTLDPAGGTYNGQVMPGKRGGIYAWNKLNLQDAGNTYQEGHDGPTNYTYDGEVMYEGVENGYGGNGKLQDLPDTTTVDGNSWYAWSVSNSICEFYFIRTGKTDLKSQKVMRRAGEVWLKWLDVDATSNRQDDAVECDSLQDVTPYYYDVTASGVSDYATMLEDHYYVYYTNTTAWDSVYCYAWYEGDPVIEFTGDYPGKKCTFVGYDEDGYEVWCYDFGLMEDFHRIWGKDENDEFIIPSNVIFDNGKNEDHTREQTGDLVFDNGACYDYLGMVYLGNSLGGIINNGIVNGPKYTVEDDLMGVYYDEDAITRIYEYDSNGNPVYDNGVHKYIDVRGALYAKDLDKYTAKSIQPDGTKDYVYDICKHTVTESTPGGSQIQIKRKEYDQSNWVKIVLSPNFDNTHLQNTDVTYNKDLFDHEDFQSATDEGREEYYLEQYVGKIIPGGSMSGNLVDNVNPQMHITNIAMPLAAEEEYEKNVYVTGHFNDTVVFKYVHQDWCDGSYEGSYRTVPEWKRDDQGRLYVDHVRVDSVPITMFYVAPKPQEIAYITWAVFVHPDNNPLLGTTDCQEEPSEPGEFRAPMNWNRTGMLWDGDVPPDETGDYPYGTDYGPYSNGYMQYAAFQVNWSLFEDMEVPVDNPNRSQRPWYQIFKPGQAYKILALIRYAHGNDPSAPDYQRYTPGIYGAPSDNYNEGPGNHVFNAPRRANGWPSMDYTPYDDLDESKFIVFPLRGSNEDSYGDDVGNVTAVREIKVVPTSKDIVSVRYYNLMGVDSDKPFDGINIVVTTYSDGSRTSKKILR